jgi:hypothetical protein
VTGSLGRFSRFPTSSLRRNVKWRTNPGVPEKRGDVLCNKAIREEEEDDCLMRIARERAAADVD